MTTPDITTQQELDEFCVQSQFAITELARDVVVLSKSMDPNLKKCAAQLFALDLNMKAIQHHTIADETYLNDDLFLKIQRNIVHFSEWRL